LLKELKNTTNRNNYSNKKKIRKSFIYIPKGRTMVIKSKKIFFKTYLIKNKNNQELKMIFSYSKKSIKEPFKKKF